MRQIFSNANHANSTFSGGIEAKSTASYELKVTFTKEGYVKNIFSFKSTLSNLKTAWQECLKADRAKTLAQKEYAAANKKRVDYEHDHIIPSVPARRAELEAVLKAKQEELAALSAVLCEMRTELQQLETTINQLASVLHAPAQVLWFRLLLAFYSVYEAQHQNKRVRNDQAHLSSVPYVPLNSLKEVRHELHEFLGINPSVEMHRCVRSIPVPVDLESKASGSPVLIEPVVVLPDAKVAATSVLIEPVVGLPDTKVAATSVPIEPVVVLPDAKVAATSVPIEPLATLPDYETAVSAEFSVALPGSGLSSSVDRPALDEKAPHIIHQPCQQRVDSYYYWLALLFQSGALAQSTDCPHAHCDEPITIASLDGSISPAQLAIMAQCLAVLPAPLQAQMSDPYEAVRQALKQPQGDAKSASGSLPSLLQPFASRVGEALASNSSGFYISLLPLFTQAVAEGVNGCFYPKEFLAHSRGQTYDRMIAGSEFRLSDLSHHFYTHELQVLANLFELNIAVIAKGHEPVIIAPYASTDAQESTDMPAPAYLVLYYEAQGESFAYRRLSFSPDTDLSLLFSRITGVSFTMPVPAEHSDTEETVRRRASYVPIADGPAESPAIEAEVRAVLGASVSGEQADLSEERDAKLEVARAPLTLTRQTVPDDGNCFFSAVVFALRAYSLPNQPTTQEAVRDEIAKWASHLASDSPLLQGESLSVYQDAVRTNRWGGEPEFRAVAEIYGVPLVMLISGNHPALYQPQSEESSVLPRPAMLIGSVTFFL